MSPTPVGQPERATQNRVTTLFRDEPGYRYLDDWTDREGNSNIEAGLLANYLIKAGYDLPLCRGAHHNTLKFSLFSHNNCVLFSRQLGPAFDTLDRLA